MKRNYLMIFFAITALLGCTHAMRVETIRVDADSYIQNRAFYEGKPILITADLEDVLENYEVLQGMDLEVTAPITHFEERDSASWFLTLEKDGKKISAYEDYPLRGVPPNAVYLARWAKREGGGVTARGELKKWGMELDQLTYKNFIVNTNTVSPST